MYFIISTNLFGNLKKRSYEFEQIDFVVVTNTGDSDFRARLTHFSTKTSKSHYIETRSIRTVIDEGLRKQLSARANVLLETSLIVS